MQILKNVLLLFILGLGVVIAFLMASEKTPSSIALGIGIMSLTLNLALIGTSQNFDLHARQTSGKSYWTALRSYTHAHPVRGRIAQALLIISVFSIPVAHFL